MYAGMTRCVWHLGGNSMRSNRISLPHYTHPWMHRQYPSSPTLSRSLVWCPRPCGSARWLHRLFPNEPEWRQPCSWVSSWWGRGRGPCWRGQWQHCINAWWRTGWPWHCKCRGRSGSASKLGQRRWWGFGSFPLHVRPWNWSGPGCFMESRWGWILSTYILGWKAAIVSGSTWPWLSQECWCMRRPMIRGSQGFEDWIWDSLGNMWQI